MYRTSTAALILLLLAASICRADPSTQPLMAEGANSEERIWLISTIPGGFMSDDSQSVALSNDLHSADWQFLGSVGQVISAAHRGRDLVVVYENSQWVWQSSAGSTAGIALPPNLQIWLCAGDQADLWALAKSLPAATQPATLPTTAAAESTSSSPLWLTRLGPSHWEDPIPLPVANIPQCYSFTMIDSKPTFCALAENHLRILQWSPATRQWTDLPEIHPTGPIKAIHLLDNAGKGVLWILGSGEGGELWPLDGGEPIKLHLSGDAPEAGKTDIALAGDQYHLFFDRGQEPLHEQRFDLHGNPAVPLLDVRISAEETQHPIGWLLPTVISAMGLLAIFSMRNRQDTPPLPDGILPAPLILRAIAAIIDAIPLIIATALAIWRIIVVGPGGLREDQLFETAFFVGPLIYLLYALLCEVLAGRTLGKRLMNLQIVGLDGQPASPRLIVLRNLMRMPLPPLVVLDSILALFTPRHQRMGDIVAGTIVVRKLPSPNQFS